jgi:hypothetical protein
MRQIFLFLAVCISLHLAAQDIYTARSYWQETTREPYLSAKRKQQRGDSLSVNEKQYLQDYEEYLLKHFSRLTPEEQQRYFTFKPQWDLALPDVTSPVMVEEFEWRGRDRFRNALYGLYYGATVVALLDIESAAAAGIPLLTSGIWLLGPPLNPKKYEGISQSTIRASNTGKFLGLIYGASLGLTLAGDSESSGDLSLALSSVASITLGEVAFQKYKRKPIPDGYIEMLRHYGVLGPGVGLAAVAATGTESTNLIGAGLLAGGVTGLLVGNQQAKKYDYTRGDVDIISSLSVISTGLGFTMIAHLLEDEGYSEAVFLIPAGAAVTATVLGQRSVRQANFTKKQGSTVNLATAGAALVGLGVVVTLIDSDSPTLWIGVPSALALIMHQVLFHRYKRDNFVAQGIGVNRHGRTPLYCSVKFTPENLMVHQKLRPHLFSDFQRGVNNPLVKLTLTF